MNVPKLLQRKNLCYGQFRRFFLLSARKTDLLQFCFKMDQGALTFGYREAAAGNIVSTKSPDQNPGGQA